MRKYKHLVIGGIETKVTNLILITVILLIAAFIALSVYQNRMLGALTAEAGERQATATMGLTNEVMDTVMKRSMGTITGQEAEIIDHTFQDMKTRVSVLAEYATVIFANQDKVQQAPWAPPDASRNGELSAQVLFPEGADTTDPALLKKVGQIANMNDILIAMCDASGAANVYIGLESGAFLMVSRDSASWVLEDGTPRTYDPRTRYWYRQAAEAGGVVFSDVEEDAAIGELNITCAMPVYGPDGALRAVVGADLYLERMRDVVRTSDDGNGYLIVVNREGHVILAPEGSLFRAERSDQAADLRKTENPEPAALVTDAVAGNTDVRLVHLEEGAYYMAAAPVETVGWMLISVYSQEAVDAPAIQLTENNRVIQQEAQQTYRDRLGRFNTTSVLILGLLAVLALTGAILLGKRIVRPLNSITKRISEINEENSLFRMEDSFRTGDEIELLASSFANLSEKSKGYVEEVMRVTAEKERIGTELHMANQIQESMLPSIFPAFPDRKEFDIYAVMDPAKEVGGDFYDFFLIDDDHLCMVMADVSGKGVPAALFMMASKIILQSYAKQGSSAADILRKTNEAICSNNRMEMFVTVWLGILEISTGKVTAANAGHEYPCVMKDGTFTIYRDRHGFVIGGIDGITYKNYEISLAPGDKLFLYTDGVAEATNGAQEMFGVDRMVEALNRRAEGTPQEITAEVGRAVEAFVGDAEQFDDLTMLCLTYRGRDASGTGANG